GDAVLPTEAHKGQDFGLERMCQTIRQAVAAAQIGMAEIVAIGVATPGTMDIPAGMLLDPPNLPGWIDFPIRDRLAHHCRLPVSFTNDAAAAAYGEYWVGSGKGLPSLVLLTLGTGIGGGIIVNDASMDGQHSHGAECGHIIIDCREDARICSCGQPGHLEAYASALAVIRRAQEALAAGKTSSLAGRLAAGAALSPLLLAEEAEAGDALALEIVLDTARYLGIGIVNLMHTIDPSGVVLGGAMNFGGNATALGRRFIARVREEVARRAFPVLVQGTPIEYAALGGDAGFIGAAGIARAEPSRRREGTA
ncbi:MAG TPA: ROK family protein, partial [Pirellulales bacterium]|nr:ROK family protein [Pirellulales bacterium]